MRAELFLHLLTNRIAFSFVQYNEEQLLMFETAVQEKRTGIFWDVVVGLIVFAALLGTGYILIT